MALFLLVPPLWAFRRLCGKTCTIAWRHFFLFASVTLAVALPWYIAICVRLPQFAYHFLWEHNIVRYLAPFDHLRPIWFYAPVLLFGLFPALLFIAPFIKFLFCGEREILQHRPAELGFVLLAGGWCIAFFSLSSCKLPTYIMPAFPPLCLALGFFLTNSRWQATPWPGTAAVLGFLAICLGHNYVLPWYAGYRAPLGHVAELGEYCSDADTPIICYSRNCDSVAFYLSRDDLRSYRSKETHLLVYFLQQHPRTVVLFTHRHSLEGLRHALTSDLEIVRQKHFALAELNGLPRVLADRITWLMGETSLGLCDAAVIEHKRSDTSSKPDPYSPGQVASQR